MDNLLINKIGIGNQGGAPENTSLKESTGTVSNKKDFDAFMAEGLKRNYILYQVKRRDEIFFLPVKLDTLL